MSKTLIIPDVHLGKSCTVGRPGIGTTLNSRIIDQKRLLDWIIDVVKDRDVDTVILTGDIFEDVKPDYILIKIFIEWLKILNENDVNVHIIAGNHDIRRVGGLYSSALDIVSVCDFEHIYFHKNTETILCDGVGFTLLPFRDRRGLNVDSNAEALNIIENKLVYELSSIPSPYDKVLVGHFALEGAIFMDEIDDLLNELVCPLKMFAGYDFVFMGHVHTPKVYSRNPYIAHLGSLDLSDWGEVNQTKILVLFDPDTDDKFETINVPSRPLRKVRIDVPEDNLNSTQHIIDKIKEFHDNYPLNNSLFRLEIVLNGHNTPNVVKKEIEEYIYSLGAFHIPYFSETRTIQVVPIENKDLVDNTVDAKSAIKLYANILTFEDENEQNEFVALATSIIDEYHASVKEK